MSIKQNAGNLVWFLDKVKQATEAGKLAIESSDPATREQAAYDAATKLAEAVGIGIPLMVDPSVKTIISRV